MYMKAGWIDDCVKDHRGGTYSRPLASAYIANVLRHAIGTVFYLEHASTLLPQYWRDGFQVGVLHRGD